MKHCLLSVINSHCSPYQYRALFFIQDNRHFFPLSRMESEKSLTLYMWGVVGLLYIRSCQLFCNLTNMLWKPSACFSLHMGMMPEAYQCHHTSTWKIYWHYLTSSLKVLPRHLLHKEWGHQHRLSTPLKSQQTATHLFVYFMAKVVILLLNV
jgi:hypothetical protein